MKQSESAIGQAPTDLHSPTNNSRHCVDMLVISESFNLRYVCELRMARKKTATTNFFYPSSSSFFFVLSS